MAEPKPYRIIAKIKNNRLWTAIQEMFPGMNQRQASEEMNVNGSQLSAYLGMRRYPYNGKFWAPTSRRIAERLGYPLEYLFDPELYGRNPLPYVALELDPKDIPALNLISLPPAPDEALDQAGLRTALQDALLKGLTEREHKLLSEYYGLNGEARTLDDIALDMDLTRSRVYQIYNKALRKMRHPTRSRRLREYH